MALKTIIHKIDTDKTECIVSVYEDDVLIIDKVNVGINPSGNNAPLIEAISELLRIQRYNELKI